MGDEVQDLLDLGLEGKGLLVHRWFRHGVRTGWPVRGATQLGASADGACASPFKAPPRIPGTEETGIDRWQRRIAIAGALALAALAAIAVRRGAPAPTDAARDEIRRDVERVKVVGPAEVMLEDQARLALPGARMWVPQPVAGKILEAMGNRPGPRLLGLVYPLAEADDWIVVAEYEPAGYVKDDDARDWNATTC